MTRFEFPVKKGQVIELGEGHSSTARRDGIAYFEGDSVKMLPASTPAQVSSWDRARIWLANRILPRSAPHHPQGGDTP